MTSMTSSAPCIRPASATTLREEIAGMTARLNRFRTLRDRAQLRRLDASPRLKEAIAALLNAPMPA